MVRFKGARSRLGANLVPQWYYPREAQRKLETGEIMHETRTHEAAGFRSPKNVRDFAGELPDDAAVERDFDIEQGAEDYARAVIEHSQMMGPEVLDAHGFGREFLGGGS